MKSKGGPHQRTEHFNLNTSRPIANVGNSAIANIDAETERINQKSKATKQFLTRTLDESTLSQEQREELHSLRNIKEPGELMIPPENSSEEIRSQSYMASHGSCSVGMRSQDDVVGDHGTRGGNHIGYRRKALVEGEARDGLLKSTNYH